MVDHLKYNLRPSGPDSRDLVYEQGQTAVGSLVDLREWDSPVDNQYSLGSCVANAMASAYELQVRKLYPAQFVELSRLFIYYNARTFDNTVTEDVGAYIRDGIKAVRQYGVCSEQLWPYDIDMFDDRPTVECYIEAMTRKISNYRKLITLRDILENVSNHKPVVIGMAVYQSFDTVTQQSSVVPLPHSTDTYTGNHAVTIVGHDIDARQFLIKNSYGTDWGDRGYGWLPFEYVRTEAFEKWCFDIVQPPTLNIEKPNTINQAPGYGRLMVKVTDSNVQVVQI